MFKNIGRKIKGLAKIVFWVEAVLTIIAGFGTIGSSLVTAGLNYDMDLPLLVLIVLANLVAVAVLLLLEWLSVWMIYAFGELVDNSAIIAKEIKELKEASLTPEVPTAAVETLETTPSDL